jgi:hypothetical protein
MKLLAITTSFTLASVAHAGELRSPDLKQCPDGHTTLKDVPISYGLPAASTRAEWKKLQRQIDNLEFVLGGCEVDNDSPMVRPTCTTCRFGYNSRTGTWTRRSTDIHSFKRPFTDLLTSFPVLAHPRKLEYEQGVQSDHVVLEEIVYTASKDHPELKARIDQWFAGHGIAATYSKPNEGNRKVREWKAPGISIRFSYEPGELFVWLTHDMRTPKA